MLKLLMTLLDLLNSLRGSRGQERHLAQSAAVAGENIHPKRAIVQSATRMFSSCKDASDVDNFIDQLTFWPPRDICRTWMRREQINQSHMIGNIRVYLQYI